MNQTSNPFGNLSADDLEPARDVLGGGGVVETDVYDGKIALAYAGKSDQGANFLAVKILFNNGHNYSETMYVTNRNGENFYTKDGKKNPLPGFTTANDLALLSTGMSLADQDFEEKVVPIYDFDAKAEVNKKVMVATSMIGKPITVAIFKQIEDKNKKNDATGAYEPTGEFRDTNVIDKVFHNDTGKTVSEFVGKKDAEFQAKWREKNKGKVRDKSKGLAGKTGAPGKSGAPSSAGGGGTKSKSLFG